MGKKRIAVIDDSKKKEKKAAEKRKVVKTGKEHGRITDMGAEALAEAERIKAKEKELEKLEATKKQKEQKRKKKTKPTKKRGQRYLEARKKVDRNKFYPLSKAIKLAKETSISQFNGSLEVHLNVQETGLKGEINFPHPTGKTQKIRVVDDQLIKELEKGKIDFTLLVASPAMMPKLVKFAKLLGPKGLMPNPKAGTVSEKPEERAKELAGKIQFRTEPKAPLIHLVIGKADSKEKELAENFQALIEAVGVKNIQKAVAKTTMGPGIKVDLESI